VARIMIEFGVISLAPVPVDDGIFVEGGGLRAWYLSRSINELGSKVALIAPNKLRRFRQINPTMQYREYEDFSEIHELVADCKVIIFPASHYQISAALDRYRNSSKILIADAYVPNHIEFIARSNGKLSKPSDSLWFANKSNWETSLHRADYVMCAGNGQIAYYSALLAALNIVNPNNYNEDRLINTPMGYLDPPTPLPWSLKSDLRLGWIGGFYPWFDAEKMFSVFSNLSQSHSDLKLRIVGGENPFISKTDDIYKHTGSVASKIQKSAEGIEYQDWLPFSELNRAYEGLTAVLHLNQVGNENLVSWRTRLLDAIRFGIPIITNGQDQISESLLARHAAIRIHDDTISMMSAEIEKIISDPSLLETTRKNLIALQPNFLATTFSKNLVEMNYFKRATESNIEFASPPQFKRPRIHLAYSLLKNWQFMTLLRLSLRFLKRKTARLRYLRKKHGSDDLVDAIGNLVIFTPQIGLGGADVVAFDLARRLLGVNTQISIFSSSGELNIGMVKKLQSEFHISTATDLSSIPNNRYVIVNSIAHPKSLYLSLEQWMSKDSNNRAFLYVHEDRPSIWLDTDTSGLLNQLVSDFPDRFHIATASSATRYRAAAFLGLNVEQILLLPYPLEGEPAVSRQGIINKIQSSDTIIFQITGNMNDSRKGHRLAIESFAELARLRHHRMRDFQLMFIGATKEPYCLETIDYGKHKLNKRLVIYPTLPIDEVSQVMMKAHVCVCLSEYESLPRFVSQSMLLGQILVRNHCSGFDEQMRPGVNGLEINILDPVKIAETILPLLDYDEMTNEDLIAMSLESVYVAQELNDKSQEIVDFLNDHIHISMSGD
jgi:glycosyltransferase involved in cell wall biosynthesis